MKKNRRGAPILFHNGFTLVEILICITIIIGLAAIVVLMVSKARKTASAVVDANDMRAIHAAVNVYSTDHNDLLPYTGGGVGPTYAKGADWTLVYHLAPYLGRSNPQDGDFFSELAAASWQSSVKDPSAPSLMAHHQLYTGPGKYTGPNPMRPTPFTYSFGYKGQREPKTMSAVMSLISNPSNSLMFTEIDREHPEFEVSKPSWLTGIPEGMAHGSYRLGVYWDGHVSRLNKDLDPF